MKKNRTKRQSAFSLVEMIATIAVIGIIAAISIQSFGGVLGGSRKAVADDLIANLNKATRQYGYANNDITYAATAAITEERKVLELLQEQGNAAGELIPTGPFFNPQWTAPTSSSQDDYRAIWGGYAWKLLSPGDSGTGLRINVN